jgi:hypothetical protein
MGTKKDSDRRTVSQVQATERATMQAIRGLQDDYTELWRLYQTRCDEEATSTQT